MPQMSQRGRQAEMRRQQLLETALKLFSQQGFERTSIRDICEAAGVAQGLVYHYFRSKDDLLFAVLEQQSFLPELGRLLAVSPDRPAAQVLPEVAATFYALATQRQQLMQIVVREFRTNPEVAAALQHLIGQAVGSLAGYLDARVAAGELRPHDTQVTARTLFFTVVMLRLTNTPAEGFLPAFSQTLLRGIMAG